MQPPFMKIEKAKHFIKVASFEKNKNAKSKNLIKVKYLDNITQELRKDPRSFIYIFTINKVIKKIGASESKHGMKGTFSFYDNARSGRPGSTRFVLHGLIHKEIEKGKKIEIYVMWGDLYKTKIKGLYSEKVVKVCSSKLELERLCKEDYFKAENKYPDWNFQENNEKMDSKLLREYIKYSDENQKMRDGNVRRQNTK